MLGELKGGERIVDGVGTKGCGIHCNGSVLY
jgi:hypothetical protein